MNTVLIVDADATGLAADLNGIAASEGGSVEFRPLASPERLFDELANSAPKLILLHHHWEGVEIAQLLERIAAINDTVRVIVFTGQAVDIKELIECVRFGVCDYWLKRGSLNSLASVRKIMTYCSSETHSMHNLSRPSESVMGLLREAEVSSQKIASLERQRKTVEAQLSNAQSEEARAMRATIVRMIEFLVCMLVLAPAYVMVAARTSEKSALWLVAGLGVFFLFLQGKIAQAVINLRAGSARLSS